MAVRYALIGSGIAALSAAESIRAADTSATITMISEEPHHFYSRPGLAYLLRGDIPEQQLAIRNVAEVAALRVERIHTRVERLYPTAHALELADGRRLQYDRLLLATGALASAPTFPGADLVGVVKLDSLNDARLILRAAGWRLAAVVVGGGITALELAEGLCARQMRTHYLLRGKRYWSDVLDEVESQIVLQRLQHEGVTLHLETQVEQAIGHQGRLIAVQTQAGTVLDCSLLAVAIGVRPRLELARQAGLMTDRGIVVNEYLQTSDPDIFAAGDCAQVRDPRTGIAALDVLWPIALQQGSCAGANMTGAAQRYLKETPYNVTQLAGLKVTIIGQVGRDNNDDLVAISRGESESWRMRGANSIVSQRDAVNRVRLHIANQRIVGALVMGDQSWSRPLQKLIAQQVDISSVRDRLWSHPDQALEHLARFYEAWEQQARSRR